MVKASIDFGTTNTVVAVWRTGAESPETVDLPGLSSTGDDGPPLIPSLLYVEDGAQDAVLVGQQVRSAGYDIQDDERYFSSIKRGVGARNRPLARVLDGSEWHDGRAGEVFLRGVIEALQEQVGQQVSELVLTVPVQSFEHYLKWLRSESTLQQLSSNQSISHIRIVDESTAAALGYEFRSPGELVMVVDFGGGTLDVSLVRLPMRDERDGVVLGTAGDDGRSSRRDGSEVEARVVAKAGRLLGGDDVDHWLLDELLEQNEVSKRDVGDAYYRLKQSVEQAKIRLSNEDTAQFSVFDPDSTRTYRGSFTRTQLEDLLETRGFFTSIQKTIDKVLRGARTRGIYPEHISAVLLIGGTSRIPSVRRMIRTTFGTERVFEDKPFEAVAHGALRLAMGMGLDDFLYHSYGIRHLSPLTGRHEWEEIIPAGTRYPLENPVRLTLTASQDKQRVIELVIGEVEESATEISEVMIGNRAILMVDGGVELRQVVPLNDEEGSRTVAFLDPPGQPGEDRIEVMFDVDRNRTLRVTVEDLATGTNLLDDAPVVELR